MTQAPARLRRRRFHGDPPDPARPPTARDGFAAVWRGVLSAAPDARRSLTDVVLIVPVILAGLAGAHTGTTSKAGEIVEHAALEPIAVAATALALWNALRVLSRRADHAFRPHVTLTWLALFAMCVAAIAGTAHLRKSHANALGAAVTAKDGVRFRLTRRSRRPALVGIAEVLPSVPWHSVCIRRLGVRSDIGQHVTRLVRPLTAEPAELTAAPNGFVVLVRNDGLCRAAYDPAKRRALLARDLGDVSPFALQGDAGPGREDDVRAIETALAATNPRLAWGPLVRGDAIVLPREACLLDAMDHANPWVRDAARRLVRAGGPERYPGATKRL